jgi:hypothetical protein
MGKKGKMSTYTKPELREYLKHKILSENKGGKPGQWSARKAQLLVKAYASAGGKYRGSKTKAQKSLSRWTVEMWGTLSGKNSTQGPRATGERYLPLRALRSLSLREYAETTAAKRKGIRQGKQYVKQPKSIARKTSKILIYRNKK